MDNAAVIVFDINSVSVLFVRSVVVQKRVL
ncbi:hypothetical protein PC118_g23404 [Phytophthora cactorum]|uniref:Uncharacterized protein n=1 Tax=Phytophthora cactorum TaxID=29920 RepID=A0A8T1ETW6_9STRA|nr:hypothetical protein PC111_g21835 [Phytophthora cactorum]KAG2796584.1 hypothetical protein PC112_g22141 [Phytophthora cactorum]KAG2875580.1 hypothetical protein PC114_g24640 [Phytophthora cactorum]KAG2958678.1 hypothetical protein PC118_g23404 [Phytophthora cactorum]KAG2960166.1 hypothetical protein PC119_g26478 [Phytophthora cactorum]